MNDISVIIPTWNRANSIEKAVCSALQQTEPPLEVLVCDDGSTDNTEALIRGIKDSRVQWLPGIHSGLPAVPRNRGIEASKGDWLAFLDSDDAWLAEKLEKQLELAKVLGCKAVSSNALRFLPGKGIRGKLLDWDKERIGFADLTQQNQIVCSSTLVHKSLFQTVIGFPAEPGIIEDYALWLRVATQTDFAYIAEPLLIYQDDPANSVRSIVTSNVWMQRKEVFKNFLAWASEQGPEASFSSEARAQYRKALRKIEKRR